MTAAQTMFFATAHRGARPGLPLAVVLCCLAWAAAAEQPAPPAGDSPPASSQAAAPVSPDSRPGLFGAIGQWIDHSIGRVGAGLRDKSDAGEARKNAMLGLLPKSKIVSGFEPCETAPNGAPDCRGAIESLCRGKGLKAGRSLDVQSMEKCPARTWISGAQASKEECRTQSYVRRAFCQ
jgi:hypothetical protein